MRIRVAHVALTAAGAVLLAATGGGSNAESSAPEPRQPIEITLLTDRAPATSVLPAPEPAKAAAPQVEQRLAAQPSQPEPQQPGGTGDTNVTVQNGTNSTDTESGGAHVQNSAVVESRAGVDNGAPPG